MQHDRRLVVDDVPHQQQLPLAEAVVTDVERDVRPGVLGAVPAGALVDDADHVGDRGAARGGAQPVGPVRLAPVDLLPAPGDHLHRRGAAPVGAHLLGHPAGAEDLGPLRVVAGGLGPRGAGSAAGRGRAPGGGVSRGPRGGGRGRRPGPRRLRSRGAAATPWPRSARPGSARRARRRRGRRGQPGGTPQLPRTSRSPVVVVADRSRPRACAPRGGAGLHLGGVAGGPAGVQAVALAGEVGAADQVGGQLLGRLLGADPAEDEALVDDAVDLALEVRGDGAVADRVGRQQRGGLCSPEGSRAPSSPPPRGTKGRRPTVGRRHRSRWCGGGASEVLETQFGKAGGPTVPNNPKRSQVHHWSHARGASARPRRCDRAVPAGEPAAERGEGGEEWSGRRDSNSRHRPWEGRALPTELRPQRPDAVAASGRRTCYWMVRVGYARAAV